MNIAVYCGANSGNKKIYEEKAIELADWIADNHHTLVYGAGNLGLMGLVSNHVIENGGKTIGVIPYFLADREAVNHRLSELKMVTTMSERKDYMIERGEVFIALPGGAGTLEEITEVISWARIGQNDGPCILYNVDGFYDPLEKMYDNMVESGFLSQSDRDKTFFSDDLDKIEQFIYSYVPPCF